MTRSASAGASSASRSAALVVDDHELPGSELANHLGAQQVEGAALRREHPVAVEPAQDERTNAVWVAEAHQLPLRQQNG
jgi:hypothetical protein